MCGIVGVHSKNKHLESVIRNIMNLINHRGPDDGDYYINNESNIAFGYRRLAINNLTDGNQPFSHKDLTIFFNGEIFNFKELIDSEKLSDSVSTEIDLIGHLYLEYQLDMLQMLDGMFSIAIYDENNKNIYLIRDRYGIKPLFYSIYNNELYFSSEIKAIKPYVSTTLDSQEVRNYFTLGYTLNPSSVYNEIKQVEPGNYIVSNTASLSKTTVNWYNPINSIYEIQTSNLHEQCLDLLSESVIKWSLADVHISFQMSGGVDSSALLALSAKQQNNTLRTYTLGFSTMMNITGMKVS